MSSKDLKIVKPIKGARARSFFIVGMPRSGTKLLRALLDNHPSIAITPIETEFLPYLVKNWNNIGKGIEEFVKFEDFYKQVIQFPYFIYMEERGKLISANEWYRSTANFNPAGVFEALIKHDTEARGNMIWGDKSPSYINHISLIKKLYPDAKVIFIVRDVRDYCLSINKAWGKNIMRAAQRWQDDIQSAIRAMATFPDDCYHVRYEDLLDNPEVVLKKICAFMQLDFVENMLNIASDTENKGDAKGYTEVVRTNKNKYIRQLSDNKIKKIEGLTWPTLQEFGYDVKYYHGKLKRISNLRMILLMICDALNVVKSETKKRGIVESLFFHSQYKKITKK